MAMKYEIEERMLEEESMIRGAGFEYSPDGRSVLAKWDWPTNARYNECMVFEVPETEAIRGISLRELLDSQCWHTVIQRITPSPCSRPLTDEGKQFFFFPARYEDENETLYLLDQTRDNKTQVWRRRIVISPVISYEPIKTGLLGLGKATHQIATISLNGTGRGMDGYLVYRVGNEPVRYGIDLARFAGESLQVEIGINEKIVFEKPKRDMMAKIELRLTKRG